MHRTTPWDDVCGRLALKRALHKCLDCPALIKAGAKRCPPCSGAHYMKSQHAGAHVRYFAKRGSPPC